ncbi:MAG: Abi family protein [Cellulosilyticum sp.]|nr:Abi family protein [Cellulosilyticum sp.]
MKNKAKPFQSIDDQINLLKKRNLTINDDEIDKARSFLLNNNYYRISGYTLTLRSNDKFYDNATLDNVIQIYNCDKRMRHIILSITEEIEIRIKTMVAYYHSKRYGALGYLDMNNFNCKTKGRIDADAVKEYLHITRKADTLKNMMTDTEAFLKHHKEEKDGLLPFWVYVEVLTISDISKLYSLLEYEIQLDIAKEFGYHHKSANNLLDNLLHSVTILRNICAHGGRLYNRLFIRKPRLSTQQKKLLRVNENGNVVYDHLFSYILVLKDLSLGDDFSLLLEHLYELSDQYKFVDMKHYGFPDNWREIL